MCIVGFPTKFTNFTFYAQPMFALYTIALICVKIKSRKTAKTARKMMRKIAQKYAFNGDSIFKPHASTHHLLSF